VHFRDIPFLRLYAPLCAGVLAAEAAPAADTAAWILLSVAAAAMTLRMAYKGYFTDLLYGCAVISFLMASGYLLHTSGKRRITTLEERRDTFLVRVAEYPEKKSSSHAFRAKIISAGKEGNEYHPTGSLLLYFISDTISPEWKPGDRLLIRTTPRPVKNNGNPCEFDYRRYLEGQGVRYLAFIRGGDVVEYHPADDLTLRERSLTAARRMINAFEKAGLEDEALGLVTALTIGDKDLLDREQLTSFSRAGAMHIMAVSGMHVGMISLGLSFMLFFMRRRLMIARVLIITTALWGFAFITGMSPSVLRATIMFTFLQAGTLMNRPAAAMNSLLASAFILTAARPAVLFEAGFQLSYLAVAFILLFYDPLYRVIKVRNRPLDWLWQMTTVSLVAQAGTLALSVRLFNMFPLLFLATNIIVIPVSFVVMALAFLLLIFSPFGPVASFFASLLKVLSNITLGYTAMISSMHHGVIENIGLTSAEALLLTLSIALLLTSLLRVGKITLTPFLAALALFFAFGIFKNVTESREQAVINYNIRGREMRALQQGRRLFVPAGQGELPAEVKKHAAERGLKIEILQPG